MAGYAVQVDVNPSAASATRFALYSLDSLALLSSSQNVVLLATAGAAAGASSAQTLTSVAGVGGAWTRGATAPGILTVTVSATPAQPGRAVAVGAGGSVVVTLARMALFGWAEVGVGASVAVPVELRGVLVCEDSGQLVLYGEGRAGV